MTDASHTYLLEDAAPAAEIERLHAIDMFMGPTTQGRIRRLGLARGWRCLEVGAGTGGVARWLAERVGPMGQVTAVDLHPVLREDPEMPQLKVRQHDILDVGLEQGFYDLVHCRLLLVNVGDVSLALRRMTDALRPGGWLVVEEPGDSWHPAVGEANPRVEEFNRLMERFLETVQSHTRSVALDLHRRLPGLLEEQGLVEVCGELTHLLVRGAGRAALLGTLDAVGPMIAGSAFATDGSLERLRRLAMDEELLTVGGSTVCLWGQKPA